MSCQTDVSMKDLSYCESQIAECQAVENAKLARFMSKWKLGKLNLYFELWKGLSGADDVEEMKGRMEASEMEGQNVLLGNMSSMFSQGTSSGLNMLGRAFHLWEAHASLMLDARKSLENDIGDDMRRVLMMQRDDTIDLTSTVDPKKLSHKIVCQVRRLVAVQSCILLLVDPDADAKGEIFNFEQEPLQGLPDREGILYRAAMYHETFCLINPEQHRSFHPANDKMVDHEMHNILALPLTQTSPPMGVLLLVNRLNDEGELDPEGFRPKDTQAIEIFMRQAASAVKNAYECRIHKSQQCRMEALMDEVLLMTSFREIEQVTELMPTTACKISRAGSSLLLLLTDSEGLEVVSQTGDCAPDVMKDAEWMNLLNMVIQDGEVTDGPDGSLCVPILANGDNSGIESPDVEGVAANAESIEQCLGVLVVCNPLRGFFNTSDEVVLVLYTQQAATAILNLELFNTAVASQKRQQDLERASKAAQLVWENDLSKGEAGTALEKLSRSVMQHVAGILHPTGGNEKLEHKVGVFLREDWMALDNVLVMSGEAKHFTVHSAQGFGGIASEVMSSNQMHQCIVKDTKSYDAKYDVKCDPGSSLVTTSMHIEGQDTSIGCIQVARAGGKPFSDIEIGLIQMFSVKVALRLSLEQLQTCSEHLHLQFNSLAEVWSSTSDPHEAIARLVNNLIKMTSASMASFYAVQRDPGGMCEAFLVHSTDSIMPSLIPITKSSGVVARAVMSKQLIEGAPSTLSDYNETYDAPDASWRAGHSVAHIVCIPVMAEEEKVHGVLHILMEEKEGQSCWHFSENDIDAMKTVTNFLAGLTHWAKMEADTERLGGQSSRLAELVTFLCNPEVLDSDGKCCVTTEQLVLQTKEVVSAHVAVLYELTPEGLQMKILGYSASFSVEDDGQDDAVNNRTGLVWNEETASTRFVDLSGTSAPKPIPLSTQGILTECAESKKMVQCQFERQADGAVLDPSGRFNAVVDQPSHVNVAPYEVSSMVCAPVLNSENETLGVIQVISTQVYHHYDAEDITLVEMLLPCFATVMEIELNGSDLESNMSESADPTE